MSGKYTIVEFIDSGGMADVYEATDANGEHVALKMLPVELTRSEEALLRFYSEIKQAREVEHHNVVRYVDHGDGTVSDATTGLMWQKSPTYGLSYEAALSAASSIATGHHSVSIVIIWSSVACMTNRRSTSS